MNLQLATSQYGVESSTPQPRILTAIEEEEEKLVIDIHNKYEPCPPRTEPDVCL
jgi:hypothetical protein